MITEKEILEMLINKATIAKINAEANKKHHKTFLKETYEENEEFLDYKINILKDSIKYLQDKLLCIKDGEV